MTRRKFHVPIWDVYLHVVVARDPVQARVKMNRIFGEWDDKDDFYGLLCWKGRQFGLFLETKPSLELVAHEVFHATHRILERAEANFDAAHHEQAAYLHGWLMERVWRIARG